MPDYMGAISDLLRKEGYPEDISGLVKQVVLRPNMAQPQIIEDKRDEFRSKDNQWSVNIGDSMVALVTSAYDRFAGFSKRLKRAIEIVDQVAEIRHGQVHRIGLRYVDVIDPREGETVRQYLQPSLHGPTTPTSNVITGPERMMALESVGRTAMGIMTVRISQNDQGLVVPPDVMHRPMNHKVTAEAKRVITLFDTDHYTEGAWDFDLTKIMSTVDSLHGGINAAWFQDFITDHALKAWEAVPC